MLQPVECLYKPRLLLRRLLPSLVSLRVAFHLLAGIFKAYVQFTLLKVLDQYHMQIGLDIYQGM